MAAPTSRRQVLEDAGVLTNVFIHGGRVGALESGADEDVHKHFAKPYPLRPMQHDNRTCIVSATSRNDCCPASTKRCAIAFASPRKEQLCSHARRWRAHEMRIAWQASRVVGFGSKHGRSANKPWRNTPGGKQRATLARIEVYVS